MIQGMRFVFAIFLCVANIIIYGLKVNMGVAIIAMVKKSTGNGTDETTIKEEEEKFDWSPREQGLILSLYFAGYLMGMFPSGYFANRFNTKVVLMACVFFNAIATLGVPLAARSGLTVLYALRWFTGLVSAANLPIVNVMVGKWVVFEEKSLWVAIIYSGTSLGTVISFLSTGWIIEYLGWQMVFYIHGSVPFVWLILYGILFAESPEEQKWITEEERDKLVKSIGHSAPGAAKTREVPWKAIFTSVPFIALLFTNTLGNFTWYLLLTLMPLYMAKILDFDIKSNATITCSPYLINVILNPLLGKLLDYGRRNEWWSQTKARKIAVTVSCVPAILMITVIAIFTPDRTITVILLCASIVTSGAIFVGHLINQNDLSPNYAGILMGITNTPGTIGAFFLPWLIGYLCSDGYHTVERWQVLFSITIVAQLSAFVIFMVFGKAEVQPWNDK